MTNTRIATRYSAVATQNTWECREGLSTKGDIRAIADVKKSPGVPHRISSERGNVL